MDDPRDQMQAALKEAMRNKDTVRRDVLRMTLNAVKQEEIDKQTDLSAEDVVTVLQREVKKRRDSVEEAKNSGRDDLADQEAEQLAVLESFLPQQLSREEIVALVQSAIAEAGAESPKDMGKVMGVLMPKVKGVADGKLVNEVVREQLSS
ncbi:MAG: GatB/YqeY domain-containing protein [Chloroflexi bacterium]|nr:GatB/YqeY domain-containing protein [Chloroflexota bacterium]